MEAEMWNVRHIRIQSRPNPVPVISFALRPRGDRMPDAANKNGHRADVCWTAINGSTCVWVGRGSSRSPLTRTDAWETTLSDDAWLLTSAAKTVDLRASNVRRARVMCHCHRRREDARRPVTARRLTFWPRIARGLRRAGRGSDWWPVDVGGHQTHARTHTHTHGAGCCGDKQEL